MSVKDVADIIKSLGHVVNSTGEVIDAVDDGRKFLRLHPPGVQQDYCDLLAPVQQTIEGLSKVTGMISSFRFGTNNQFSSYTIK